MSNFADDNFMIEWSLCQVELKTNMENKLKLVTEWLSNSGLKVNETKTELCIFYKSDTNQMVLNLNGIEIKSSNSNESKVLPAQTTIENFSTVMMITIQTIIRKGTILKKARKPTKELVSPEIG